VLDGSGSQHQYEAKTAILKGLAEALCNLRRLWNAVEVAEFVRLIEDQHLKPIFREFLEIETRRVVGRDNGSRFTAVCVQQGTAGGAFSRDVKFRIQLFLPLRAEQLWANDECLRQATTADELTHDEPGADCLSEADIVGKQCDRQAPTKCDEVTDLVMI